MSTHADKTQGNKSQSVTHEPVQQQRVDESSLQFADTRPESIAQRKLQALMNNSPRAMQLKSFQTIANNSPKAQQSAQLQAMANHHTAQQPQPIQKKENNTGLPDDLKTGMENLSGMSLNHVKVHYNSSKPAAVQAHAYAQGSEIHLTSGQEQHLPHELGHVVQQAQGRVQPTTSVGGVQVNDNPGLETEATVMGARALQMVQRVPPPCRQSHFPKRIGRIEMKVQVPKTQENKSQTAASSLPVQQRNQPSTFQFRDERPETVAQRKIQATVRNSTEVQRSQGIQEMANHAYAHQQGAVKQLRTIQPTVGGATPVIQRYFDMSKGHVFGYGKGTGAVAPQFEFQKTEAIRTEDDTTSTARYDVHSTQTFHDAPKLKVSNNYDMAVATSKGAEAKHFFATPARIAASKVALGTADAPLTLLQETQQITLPGSFYLNGVPLHSVAVGIAPALITSSECGTFANNILRVNVHRIELQMAGATAQRTVLPGGMGNRDAALNTALAGHAPETVGANKYADPAVGEAFGIFARHVVPPIGLFQQLWNEITTVHGLLNARRPHMQWSEHWAGVVAKSGGDYVTLENYNRAAAGKDLVLERLEKDYKEIQAADDMQAFVSGTDHYKSLPNEWRAQRLVRLGRDYMRYGAQIGGFTGFYEEQLQNMWYFAMYGSEKQSFHETWKGSAPDGVTTKVT